MLVFFSGFAALVYELLWFRQLGLIFGNTAHAAATVLAAFMLGLAWGANRAQRWSEKTAEPVRLFALLEVGIGLYALAVPAAFALTSGIYQAAARQMPDALPLLTALRFVLSLLVMLVPTILMGASLPILAEAVLRARERFAERLGLLYGSNTAGATAGVLACGFLLVPLLGVRASNWLAAAINFGVGIAALLLSRRAGLSATLPATTRSPPAPATCSTTPYGLLLVAALCGFLALGFETVWFRALVLVFGSTSHSFAIMVASFLVGLALGAAALGRLADKPGRAGWVLAATQVGMGLWTFFSLRLYNAAPDLFLQALSRLNFSWNGMLLSKAALAAVFLLPLAMLSGLAFTAIVRLVRERTASAGHAVGAAFSANSLGSAAGAVVAGFALLPACGMEKSLLILGGGAVLLGLGVAWQATPASAPRRFAFVAATLAIAVGAYLQAPRWDPLLLSAGAYFSPQTHVQAGQVVLRNRLRSTELVFYREGATATIAVTRAPDGRLFFTSDGKVEADTSPASMVLQRMMGHLPMLLHPNPRRVLNIGLGAGCTAGALTCYPDAIIDVVDIEPAVTNVAAAWAALNHDVMASDRIRLVINDGRNHLLVADQPYDVITSDPFEPVLAGAASLYTVEHFALARSRLAPGGVMAQFLPLYELSREDVLIILRSFLRVYPRSAVFFTGTDTVLLGFTENAPLQLAMARAKFAHATVRASLAEVGVDRPERLLDMLVMDFFPGEPAIEVGTVHTDNQPVIEFTAPKSALVYQPDINQRVLLNTFHDIPAAYLADLSPEVAAQAQRGHAALKSLLQANLMRSAGDARGALALLIEATREAPENPIVQNARKEMLAYLAREARLGDNPREAMQWYQAILEIYPHDFWALHNLVPLAQELDQPDLAQNYLQQGIEHHPNAPLMLALRGRNRAAAGDPAGACADLQAALQRLPLRADFWDDYAAALDQSGKSTEAHAARKRARQARAW